MPNDRNQERKIVDIVSYPLKIEFVVDDEIYFSGKIWDMSSTGLGVIVSVNDYIEVQSGQKGILHIWKISNKSVDIPATCMWMDKSYGIRFYGFKTDVNLYDTELRQYLE
jgi:hypothetical protein